MPDSISNPSRSPSPSLPESQLSFKVSSQVTYYVSSGAVLKGKKPKEKKEMKTKEFSHEFCATQEAYLLLLSTILAKHATIRDKRPSKIVIYVDMAEVQKPFKNACCDMGSDSDSGNDDDQDNEVDGNGLSEYDHELAWFCWLLEKKYQNDHNAGYTYINKTTGASFPLTPVMMREWYEGEATIKQPPNAEMFDPANHQAVLNPVCQIASQPSPVTPVAGGLAEISAFLTTVSKLMGVGAAHGIISAPATPMIPLTLSQNQIASPTTYTPLKLSQFLQH
ncbi:hypothetical protein L208DRAFT_1383235 [Tricholoma matsutake]|nr:hypothetical protein L208DRAFT_1383235 [Tricholoma matsutake 945]